MFMPTFSSIPQAVELTSAFMNPLVWANHHQCDHDCVIHEPTVLDTSLQTKLDTLRPAETSVPKPAEPQDAAPIITNHPMAMDTNGMAVFLDTMDEEQMKASVDNSASTNKRDQTRKCSHGKRYVT